MARQLRHQRRVPGDGVVVLGSMLAVIAIFDATWGLTTVVVGRELMAIANALDANKIQMVVGGFVRLFTLGLFNLSGVETGQHAKDLLATLPRADYLVVVGWVRTALSLTALLLGVALATRRRWALWPTVLWATIAFCWSLWVTWHIWEVLTDGIGDPWQGQGLPLFAFELSVHFIWPVILAGGLLLRRCTLMR